MITIEMIKTLLEIVSLGVTISKHVFTPSNKKAIAEWMINLGKIVGDVADKLQKREYPHNLCAQMDQHVQKFHELIEGNLPEKEAGVLHQLLRDSVEIEKTYSQLYVLSPEDREKNLEKLWGVSGKLIATGEQMLLKI